MSQFDTLSKDFKDSLTQWGEKLREEKQAAQKDSNGGQEMSKLAHAFVDGPFRAWYEKLDGASQSEVRRVFAEIREFSPEELLALARSESHTTPMGFVDGLFAAVEESSEEDVVEEGPRADEAKQR